MVDAAFLFFLYPITLSLGWELINLPPPAMEQPCHKGQQEAHFQDKDPGRADLGVMNRCHHIVPGDLDQLGEPEHYSESHDESDTNVDPHDVPFFSLSDLITCCLSWELLTDGFFLIDFLEVFYKMVTDLSVVPTTRKLCEWNDGVRLRDSTPTAIVIVKKLDCKSQGFFLGSCHERGSSPCSVDHKTAITYSSGYHRTRWKVVLRGLTATRHDDTITPDKLVRNY